MLPVKPFPAPDNFEVDGSTRPLPELAVGEAATVAGVRAEDVDAARLKSMGICIGRRIELVKAGDPLIVRILGTRVGLSARLAAAVDVQPIAKAVSA